MDRQWAILACVVCIFLIGLESVSHFRRMDDRLTDICKQLRELHDMLEKKTETLTDELHRISTRHPE